MCIVKTWNPLVILSISFTAFGGGLPFNTRHSWFGIAEEECAAKKAMLVKWQPTPVFLPGESQGRGSLVGYRLWGRTVRHDWSDLAAAAAVQLQNPIAEMCLECGRAHSILEQAIFFLFYRVFFFCFLLPLNFTLKLWLVWMWNSRINVAKTTEFHTASTWKKYSTQPCSKLGPCFAKSFMNVTEPGFET